MAPREFAKPVELAALKGRLQKARELEARIGDCGRRYDAVLSAIEEKLGQSDAHAGELERYDAELAETIRSMTGESNFPPADGGSGSPEDRGLACDGDDRR
jgi:hypothetical protein